MKEEIQQLFEQYTRNLEEWSVLEHNLMDNMPKHEWIERLEKTTYRKKQIFHENDALIRSMKGVYAHCFDEHGNLIDEESLDAFYEALFDQYMESFSDFSMNLELFQLLDDYFDRVGDLYKRTAVDCAIHYCTVTLANPEYRGESIGMEYNERVRDLLEHYTEYDDRTRYRIAVSFYYYIDIAVDMGVVSVRDGFAAYRQFNEVMMREDVRRMDD